jgi:hypothetical protein
MMKPLPPRPARYCRCGRRLRDCNRSGQCACCLARSAARGGCPICERPHAGGRLRWCRDCKAEVALALTIHTRLCPRCLPHARQEERLREYEARAARGEPLFARE